jgi:TolA-binding protein
MKCNSCGCENREQDKFCKNCGMQLITVEKKEIINEIPQGDKAAIDDEEGATTLLTAPVQNNGAVTAENAADSEEESEENTTVLTDLGMNAAEGFTPAQPGANAPEGFTPIQPGRNQVENISQGDEETGELPQNIAESKQTKKSGGVINKVYLAASIVVMLGLAGAGAYFYITHTSKIADLDAEIEALTDKNEELSTDNSDKDTLLADYEEQIAELKSDIESGEDTIASLQEDISEYSSSSEYYASYNGLIGFADANTGTSSSTFFASDTVLHMTTDEMYVYIYVPETTDLNYYIENTDVAVCEWVGWENDNVAILKVTPGNVVGSTKITLSKSNSQSEEADDEADDTSEETTEETDEVAATEETLDIFVYNN